jgi:hypothetical protein
LSTGRTIRADLRLCRRRRDAQSGGWGCSPSRLGRDSRSALGSDIGRKPAGSPGRPPRPSIGGRCAAYGPPEGLGGPPGANEGLPPAGGPARACPSCALGLPCTGGQNLMFGSHAEGRTRRTAVVADRVHGPEQAIGKRTFMHLISAPRHPLKSLTRIRSAKNLVSSKTYGSLCAISQMATDEAHR